MPTFLVSSPNSSIRMLLPLPTLEFQLPALGKPLGSFLPYYSKPSLKHNAILLVRALHGVVLSIGILASALEVCVTDPR
ncbi:hypothetical protein NMY22_g9707 [Coprinellus aureogranulatus]|nr:hypothetical protein NMY22_g9707 [Coprinellus aureogranulatus]